MSEDAAVSADSTPAPSVSVPHDAEPVAHGGQAEVQSELDLGVVSTGSPEVDAALSPLEQLPERAVAEHPEVYDQVLEALTATMTATAEHPAEDGAARPGDDAGHDASHD